MLTREIEVLEEALNYWTAESDYRQKGGYNAHAYHTGYARGRVTQLLELVKVLEIKYIAEEVTYTAISGVYTTTQYTLFSD